jgi:hypothetical protein
VKNDQETGDVQYGNTHHNISIGITLAISCSSYICTGLISACSSHPAINKKIGRSQIHYSRCMGIAIPGSFRWYMCIALFYRKISGGGNPNPWAEYFSSR